MKRSLSLRVWLPATMLAALLVASILVWRTAQTHTLELPIKILRLTAADPGGDQSRRVMPEQAPHAEESLHDPAQRTSSTEPPAAPSAVPAVHRLEGAAFIARIERTTTLSHRQRERLTNTLKLAATVQKEIDTMDDSDVRTELQGRLAAQVRTRLQMILPEDAWVVLDEVNRSRSPIAFEFGYNP